MGRITEARGDEAMEILDQLMEIIESLGKDKEMQTTFKSLSIASAVQFLVRKHREEVYKLMALDDGVTVEEERGLMSALSIPVKLMRLMHDPSVRELFFGVAAATSAGNGSSAASGSGNG